MCYISFIIPSPSFIAPLAGRTALLVIRRLHSESLHEPLQLSVSRACPARSSIVQPRDVEHEFTNLYLRCAYARLLAGRRSKVDVAARSQVSSCTSHLWFLVVDFNYRVHVYTNNLHHNVDIAFMQRAAFQRESAADPSLEAGRGSDTGAGGSNTGSKEQRRSRYTN